MELHITTPKTRAGTRIIPMFSDVRAALLQIRLKHMEEGFNECEVDGYTNFIFKNRFGEMLNPHVINRALERIIRDCYAHLRCPPRKRRGAAAPSDARPAHPRGRKAVLI